MRSVVATDLCRAQFMTMSPVECAVTPSIEDGEEGMRVVRGKMLCATVHRQWAAKMKM